MNQTQNTIDPKIAYQLLSSWRKKPQIYFKDVLGVKNIWTMQDELLDACPRAIKEHKPIYLASGHSLGKDWACGGISLWFLHSYVNSIVIQTAPTDRQVKKIMWGETLSHWNNKLVDLGGKAYKIPYLEIIPESWYLLGFTTKESGASKKAEGGKFQGFHSQSVCVIVSEAQAVEDEIYDQIDAITTTENILVIFIGNPTRASGRFAKGLRDKKHNIVFNFSCLMNPNYLNNKEVIPGLCSHSWVEDKRDRWGEDDPRWHGRVLGIIPKTSINNVFSQSDVDLGISRNVINLPEFNAGVSIDSAGEGDDENVIYGGVNGMVKDQLFLHKQSASMNALSTQNMNNKLQGNFIIIDCDGMGIKEYQELINIEGLSEKISIVKFHGCATIKTGTDEELQFQNVRAMATFKALERLKNGLAHVPQDEILIEELLEVKWFTNSRGKVQIEDKKDLKDRLGRSPNRADAWVMLQYGFSLEFENRRSFVPSVQDRQGLGELIDAEKNEMDYAGY